MSKLLVKSNESKLAAEILAKEKMFHSSVSRYYYCYVEYILHLLETRLKHRIEDFNKSRDEGEGSHRAASKIVAEEIYKIQKKQYSWYKTKDKEFKQLRVEADYSEVHMTIDNVSDATTYLDILQNNLKTIFKV